MYFGGVLVDADSRATAEAASLEFTGLEQLRRAAELASKASRINGSRLKRALDAACALVLILVLVPVFVVVPLALLLQGGPVIFRQQRYGANRQIFYVYKFQTMTVTEAAGGFTQAMANDPRITPMGRILRRTSIDELPQLFNVLRGEMSLVGPRPHALAMDDAFATLLPNYSDRHLVRPGLTGLAQVAGYRGPTDEVAKIEARLMHDCAYIRSWSPLLDIAILLRTPLSLFNANAL